MASKISNDDNAILSEKLGLSGKKVVLTGGSRGIGKTIALELSSIGCLVAILDILAEEGRQTADEITGMGGTAYSVHCDVTNEGMVAESFKKARDLMGGIDILVNNAGISSNKISIEELDLDFWKKVIDINLTGSFICSRAVIKYFKSLRKGNIIMISSGSTVTGTGGTAAYAASKAGINSLIRSLSRELAPFGIRANGVAPRYIDSELLKIIYKGKDISELTGKIPLGRLGTHKDVADAVIFLASEMSGYITGEVILLDGGSTFGSR